jgi:hypothetical protein
MAVQNVRDSSRGDAKVERKPIGAQAACRKLTLQQAARMNDRRHADSLCVQALHHHRRHTPACTSMIAQGSAQRLGCVTVRAARME